MAQFNVKVVSMDKPTEDTIYPLGHFDFITQTATDEVRRWSLTARIKAAVIAPLRQHSPIPSTLALIARKKAAELLGKKRPVSIQTIYKWLEQFNNNGLDGLERKPRSGESQLHLSVKEYISDLLITKSYSLAKVVRIGQKYAREELQLPEDQWPTYDQVRYIDNQLCAAVKTYGREGRRAYRQKHELSGRFEAEYRNQLWQVDHHKCDFLIYNHKTKI